MDLIERWVIVRRGKGGKSRVIPIRGRVIRLFEEFMLTPIPKLDRVPQRQDFILYPTGSGPYGPTWSDPTRSMAYSTFWRWWERCVRRAEVRYRKPHMSRHSYATKLARASGNLAAVQKALGHGHVQNASCAVGGKGADQIRTGVRGFAGLCLTTRPRRRAAGHGIPGVLRNPAFERRRQLQLLRPVRGFVLRRRGASAPEDLTRRRALPQPRAAGSPRAPGSTDSNEPQRARRLCR